MIIKHDVAKELGFMCAMRMQDGVCYLIDLAAKEPGEIHRFTIIGEGGKHASRHNVETTITAARTKTGQSLQYERLLTKEGNTPGQKSIQHSMCKYEN